MIYFLFCSDQKAGLKLITKISEQIEPKGEYKILELDENTHVEAITKLMALSNRDNIFVSINSGIELDFNRIVDYVGVDMYKVWVIKRDLKYILQFMDKNNIDMVKLLEITDRYHNTELVSYDYPDNIINFNTMCEDGFFNVDGNTITLSDEFTLTNNITQYEKDSTVFDNFSDSDLTLIKGTNFISRDNDNNTTEWYLNSFLAPDKNTENYAINDGDKDLTLVELLDSFKDELTKTELTGDELTDNEQIMLSKLSY